MNANFSEVNSTDFWHKLVTNGREIVQNDLPRLGGSWLSAFFLVGLLVPFRNPRLNRLRWFLLFCLGLMILVQALSRTGKTVDKGTIAQLNMHPGKDVIESPGAPKKNQPPVGTPPPAGK